MVLLPRTNMVVFAESALKPFLTLPYLTNVSQNRKSFCSLFASCFCIVKSKDGIIKAGCWKLISLNDEMTLGKYSRERETGMILFITLWLLIYAFESGVRTISMRQWKAWDHDFFLSIRPTWDGDGPFSSSIFFLSRKRFWPSQGFTFQYLRLACWQNKVE